MSSKSEGANYGAVMKVGMRVASNKPPKRSPYGYDEEAEKLKRKKG